MNRSFPCFLHHSTYCPDEDTLRKAKAWYARHKGDQQLRNRIAAVNQAGLSDALVEPLKLRP